MEKKVRVRFAPSPTGGLHVGGVRTALFNYLFARKHGGTFVLRIEDTDQNRFVEGAENYIAECLDWCGISPDESPAKPGAFGPYRQSERKASYKQFAEELVRSGHAYYAFDTPSELEEQRRAHPNFQYGQTTRMNLRNSLSLPENEVAQLLEQGAPHVIRIKVEPGETVSFVDMIRGFVEFDTSLVDDKVLLKADGMPTYHLAVVVDDRAMEISHIFRGEEWLPSAPVHLLLWKYLGWADEMPQWAHLPLILKPDGHGKLSKRDGERLGFPVYAMDWKDPITGNISVGYKEMGFLPEAFVNMLALLGWNDGTEQELFNLEELVSAFSIDRISKAGAKFDFEKAKWFNHAWIMNLPEQQLTETVEESFFTGMKLVNLSQIVHLVKDRCTLMTDFVKQTEYFFVSPKERDFSAVKGKWSDVKTKFFTQYAVKLHSDMTVAQLEEHFKQLANDFDLKPGELMLPFRIMLVGGKFGPGVFDIAHLLGPQEVAQRIESSLMELNI